MRCVTMLLWGVWGALAGVPGEHGVPETLNYIVWALTMIPPARARAAPGRRDRCLRDRRSVDARPRHRAAGRRWRSSMLFYAVRVGPPYLIFPIISLSPALTIALSFALLKERTGLLGVLGIALALLALPLFDYRADGDRAGYGLWFVLALGITGCLGRAGLRHQARER